MSDEEKPGEPVTEIVTKPDTKPEISEEVVIETSNELVVIARNPQQMVGAQAKLVSWATSKLSEAQDDHKELEENHALAKKNKWRTVTLERHVSKALHRVEFYEKIKAALEAGYIIVPNIASDVFAIRTTKKNPKRNMTQSWSVNDQESNTPPAGKGSYKNSEAETFERTDTTTGSDGKPRNQIVRWAENFKDVEFPFQLAKPAIMEATAEAMALKIFDDVTVSPPRNNNQVTRHPFVKGDPMVVGRIIYRDGYATKAVSFLISWFIDTKDLP